MMFKQPLTASVFFSVHWRDGAALSTGADHRLAITWPSPGHGRSWRCGHHQTGADWQGAGRREATVSHDVSHVCELAVSRLSRGSRLLVGIAGPPASGKSTFAEAVVSRLNQQGGPAASPAALLPMDGYHLDNGLLRSRGLLARKGAPQTFDSHGFCDALLRLQKADTESFFPRFDRQRDLAVANAISVAPDVGIVVVEGNYLLLKADPWSRLERLFGLTVFLSPGLDVLRQRLQSRWITHGLDQKAALHRVTQNDLPNAELVLAQSRPADLLLTQD